MKLLKSGVGVLGSFFILAAISTPTVHAQEKKADKKDQGGIEQIQEMPRSINLTSASDGKSPVLTRILFFEPGTYNTVQSVKAGQFFDIVISLNEKAKTDVPVVVPAFRLDTTVFPVQAAPIVGDKYWKQAPEAPEKIKTGNQAVRITNVQVSPNATQPPMGNPSGAEPVQFPDFLIFVGRANFGMADETILFPTLRITKFEK